MPPPPLTPLPSKYPFVKALDVKLPTKDEIVKLCTGREHDEHKRGLAYPPEAPVSWIKYAPRLSWSEVHAQAMAYHELRRLRSHVKAPALYDAFVVGYTTYIVMEYVTGKTGFELLDTASTHAQKQDVYRQMVAGFQELLRIPVPSGFSRPAAIDGGVIRHMLFDPEGAPRHYETVDQLEQHLNLFLKITKRKLTLQGLSLEPLVFCHSDIYLGNFVVSPDGITVIDYGEVSILPSSFAKWAVTKHKHPPEFGVSSLFDIPCNDGVDNTEALQAATNPMIASSSKFAEISSRIPGDKEPWEVMK